MKACRKIFIERTVSMYLFNKLHNWDYGTQKADLSWSRNLPSLQTGEICSAMNYNHWFWFK